MRFSRLVVASILSVVLLGGGAAVAGVFGGSPSGAGLTKAIADGLYCALAGCTMTGTVSFNNGGANGTIVPQSGAAALTLLANGTGGAVRLAPNGNNNAVIGSSTSPSATQVLGCFSDNISSGSAGNNDVCVFGGGKLQVAKTQAATCSGGVLALDPTSSVAYINANSAACVVTLGEANAQVGSDVEIVLTANVSGAVTFPNVANVHAGPTVCTTTGLSTIGSSYRIHYAQTINEYVGVSCNPN